MGFRSNSIGLRLIKKNNWISRSYSKFDYKIESIKHNQVYAYIDSTFQRLVFKKAVILYSHMKLRRVHKEYIVTLYLFDRWGEISVLKHLKKIVGRRLLKSRTRKGILLELINKNKEYGFYKKNLILFYRVYYKLLLPYIKHFLILQKNSLNLQTPHYDTTNLLIAKIIYSIYNKHNLVNIFIKSKSMFVGFYTRGIRKHIDFIMSIKNHLKVILKLMALLNIILKRSKNSNRDFIINTTFNKINRINRNLKSRFLLLPDKEVVSTKPSFLSTRLLSRIYKKRQLLGNFKKYLQQKRKIKQAFILKLFLFLRNRKSKRLTYKKLKNLVKTKKYLKKLIIRKAFLKNIKAQKLKIKSKFKDKKNLKKRDRKTKNYIFYSQQNYISHFFYNKDNQTLKTSYFYNQEKAFVLNKKYIKKIRQLIRVKSKKLKVVKPRHIRKMRRKKKKNLRKIIKLLTNKVKKLKLRLNSKLKNKAVLKIKLLPKFKGGSKNKYRVNLRYKIMGKLKFYKRKYLRKTKKTFLINQIIEMRTETTKFFMRTLKKYFKGKKEISKVSFNNNIKKIRKISYPRHIHFNFIRLADKNKFNIIRNPLNVKNLLSNKILRLNKVKRNSFLSKKNTKAIKFSSFVDKNGQLRLVGTYKLKRFLLFYKNPLILNKLSKVSYKYIKTTKKATPITKFNYRKDKFLVHRYGSKKISKMQFRKETFLKRKFGVDYIKNFKSLRNKIKEEKKEAYLKARFGSRYIKNFKQKKQLGLFGRFSRYNRYQNSTFRVKLKGRALARRKREVKKRKEGLQLRIRKQLKKLRLVKPLIRKSAPLLRITHPKSILVSNKKKIPLYLLIFKSKPKSRGEYNTLESRYVFSRKFRHIFKIKGKQVPSECLTVTEDSNIPLEVQQFQQVIKPLQSKKNQVPVKRAEKIFQIRYRSKYNKRKRKYITFKVSPFRKGHHMRLRVRRGRQLLSGKKLNTKHTALSLVRALVLENTHAFTIENFKSIIVNKYNHKFLHFKNFTDSLNQELYNMRIFLFTKKIINSELYLLYKFNILFKFRHFISKLKTLYKKFRYVTLLKMFTTDISNILQDKTTILIKNVKKGRYNADIMVKFIVFRLAYYYKLWEVVKPMLKEISNFKRSRLRGAMIMCAGRFTRRQRASHKRWILNHAGLSTYKNRISYSFDTVRLKYGICGVKVWVNHTLTKRQKEEL